MLVPAYHTLVEKLQPVVLGEVILHASIRP